VRPVRIYVPVLPCGRVPAYCASTAEHLAHDWNIPAADHQGWHCYGSSTTASGRGVGWPGGTEEPTDAMDACQNNSARPL